MELRFSQVVYFRYHYYNFFDSLRFGIDMNFSGFYFLSAPFHRFPFQETNIPLFNSFCLSIWIWTFGETASQIDWPKNSKDSTHNWILDILRIQWGTSIAPLDLRYLRNLWRLDVKIGNWWGSQKTCVSFLSYNNMNDRRMAVVIPFLLLIARNHL